MTKETIQKKIEVNKINQWVPHKLSRKPKTTAKNYNASISSENATSRCEWATKSNCKTSKKPSTWSNSTTLARSKTSPTNTHASCAKWTGTSCQPSGRRKEKWQKSQPWPSKSTWSTGRTNWQAYTPNRLRPSWRWANTRRRPRRSCNGSRRKRSNSWRKSTSITPKAWSRRNSTWQPWACPWRTWPTQFSPATTTTPPTCRGGRAWLSTTQWLTPATVPRLRCATGKCPAPKCRTRRSTRTSWRSFSTN